MRRAFGGVLVAVFLSAGTAQSGAGESGGCVQLQPEHLPEPMRSVQFGTTTADDVRQQLAGDGVEVLEKWDAELGGDREMIVEGLASMTPNHGLHYGEISFRSGAANLDVYLQMRFRFASVGGSEPVVYFASATTRADDTPSVCDPARPLADRLSEQKRPPGPPTLRRPRVTDIGYTFYLCAGDDRPIIATCNDGGVKVTFNGVKYPLRTVDYEMLVTR